MIPVPLLTLAAFTARWFVTFLSGWLVGHHLLPVEKVGEFTQDAIAAIPAAAMWIWSYRDKLSVELRAALASLTGHAKPDMKDPEVQAVAAMIKAPSAPSDVASKAAVLLLIVPALSLSGCASLDASIQKNAAAITDACADVLAVADSPEVILASMLVPVVGSVKAAVDGGCSTADGIAAMAKSATTVPWLATAKTVLQSKGTVLPPPVAPAPIS